MFMNFKKEFKANVMDYFVDEYLHGRTPNPCIACNRYVKWESLLQRSLAIGADYIATGHYARIEQLPNGRYAIRNSVTAAKDQTYALYNLTQEQLKRTLMPVGDYSKDQIRAMAEKIGLPTAHKRILRRSALWMITIMRDLSTNTVREKCRRAILWTKTVKCSDATRESPATRSDREKD